MSASSHRALRMSASELLSMYLMSGMPKPPARMKVTSSSVFVFVSRPRYT